MCLKVSRQGPLLFEVLTANRNFPLASDTKVDFFFKKNKK